MPSLKEIFKTVSSLRQTLGFEGNCWEVGWTDTEEDGDSNFSVGDLENAQSRTNPLIVKQCDAILFVFFFFSVHCIKWYISCCRASVQWLKIRRRQYHVVKTSVSNCLQDVFHFFLPHFDVICDLLHVNKRMATWSLIHDNFLLVPHLIQYTRSIKSCDKLIHAGLVIIRADFAG